MEKAGYIPGKGRTFTPSLTAKWTDEFHELLNKSGVSRNSLTEELIESGLKLKRNEHLLISTDSLTQEQIELLSSQQGQTILLNVALMLLGNPVGLRQMNLLNSVTQEAAITVENTNPVHIQPKVPEPSEVLLPKVQESKGEQDLIQSLPDRLISSQTKDTGETKLSAKEKALMKMKALNQSKGDLRAD